MTETPDKRSWLDRPILTSFPILTGEMLIFAIIILLTIVSRFYDLGVRVMSHDENLHVYFSWLFSQGHGYQHTPLMHGPLLFHLTALTFFLFGATDFSARFPEALASILTILLLWKWRRYLGKTGTLIAAVLMLISPYMLFYGRYARNEAFVGLFGVLTLYSILRYFETGHKRYLILLTVATALHFTSKETAFIYTAQAMLFLGFYLVNRVTRLPWKRSGVQTGFLIALSIGGFFVATALGLTIYNRTQVVTDASQTAAPIIPGQLPDSSLIAHLPSITVLVATACLALLVAGILLIVGYGWKNIRRERAFEMLLLLGTFVLPMLAPLPVTALGRNPIDYSAITAPGWSPWKFAGQIFQVFNWQGVPDAVVTGRFLILFVLLSIGLGLIWDRKRWVVYAAIFWGIYIVFFTTFFSNLQGIATGTVGSLGYWLAQQGVHRGNQPWYYYLLIQIPVYEFLPALGLILAAYLGLRKKSPAPVPEAAPANPANVPQNEGNFTFPLLFWWSLSSILAFTLAGEKMPWLTYHMTLPMILISGWALGQVVERLDWTQVRKQRTGLAAALIVVFLTSLAVTLVRLLGTNPPFQGKLLDQLASTNSFLYSALITLASAGGLAYVLSGWQVRNAVRMSTLVFFGLLAVLTGRAAIRAAFIDYNDPTEYLVYAHGATGIKDVMDQITKISQRTTGGQDLQLAYDMNEPAQGVAWSFKWYLRNYPNATSFDKADSSLDNVPVIIVAPNNFAAIKPIVAGKYYQMNYVRMVWPNQDYFALTGPRLKNAVFNPAMREAIFQIWLNRDYSEYAKATGESGLTVPNWSPSERMQLFVRKDIAAQIEDYSILQQQLIQTDPYAQGTLVLPSDLMFGSAGAADNQFNAPRGITVAPDGSLFVADSRNNRLIHYDASGNVIKVIGGTSPGCPYAQLPPANIPLGTFCEPWAVAVSPDGQTIFVADTWNHRIQKLAVDGTPIKAWGFGNYDPVNSDPMGLWGPRGIAVDATGRVFVADTGNKRVEIFNSDGNFLSKFGGGGLDPGQLEEPVGLVFDQAGNLYVADTWNQRIQVFTPSADQTGYSFAAQWPVSAWSGESLDNKPYLAVDGQGHLFTSDPEGFRVLEFSLDGKFVRAWGDYGTGPDGFGLPSGIAIDSQGKVWVSDSANNRIMRFTLP